MAQFLGMTFIIYIFGSAVILPIVAVSAWWVKRDCELINQTTCEWVIVPKHGEPQ